MILGAVGIGGYYVIKKINQTQSQATGAVTGTITGIETSIKTLLDGLTDALSKIGQTQDTVQGKLTGIEQGAEQAIDEALARGGNIFDAIQKYYIDLYANASGVGTGAVAGAGVLIDSTGGAAQGTLTGIEVGITTILNQVQDAIGSLLAPASQGAPASSSPLTQTTGTTGVLVEPNLARLIEQAAGRDIYSSAREDQFSALTGRELEIAQQEVARIASGPGFGVDTYASEKQRLLELQAIANQDVRNISNSLNVEYFAHTPFVPDARYWELDAAVRLATENRAAYGALATEFGRLLP